jgi:hypothetical protein
VARFIVRERSFIDNRLVEPGEEIDYDGEASANLEPVGKPVRGRQRPVAEPVEPEGDKELI